LFKSQFKWSEEDIETSEIKLVEAVVAPGSEFVGKSLNDLQFYERFGVTVLAIRHRGKLMRVRISDTKLSAGDAMLLEVKTERYNQLLQNPSFVIISEIDQPVYRKSKLIPALLIVVGVILTATLGIAPIVVSSVIGAILLVVPTRNSVHSVIVEVRSIGLLPSRGHESCPIVVSFYAVLVFLDTSKYANRDSSAKSSACCAAADEQAC
jgi:di/tricarboxylate transporter